MIRDLIWSIQRSIKRNGIKRTATLCAFHSLALFTRVLPHRSRGAHEGLEFDRKHGVNTRAEMIPRRVTVESGGDCRGNRYATILPREFHEVFRCLDLAFENYVFVDLGSGKGRVLMLASEYPFREIIGVEHALELHEIAVENLKRYRGAERRCDHVRSLHMDATKFAIPPHDTVFFLYNPFDAGVMSAVMSNLERSLEERPRDVWLVFFHGPLHETASKSDLFACVWQRGPVSAFRASHSGPATTKAAAIAAAS